MHAPAMTKISTNYEVRRTQAFALLKKAEIQPAIKAKAAHAPAKLFTHSRLKREWVGPK